MIGLPNKGKKKTWTMPLNSSFLCQYFDIGSLTGMRAVLLNRLVFVKNKECYIVLYFVFD